MATQHSTRREEAVGLREGIPAGRGDARLARWVRRHPVGAFLAWFFTVGSAISFLPLVAGTTLDMHLPSWANQLFIIASTLLGLLLPAVVITRVVDGPAGVRALLGRMLLVRASVGWYAVALLAVPATAALVAMLLYGPPVVTASRLFSALVGGLLLQTALGFVTTNLWEETAWMGFAQARLHARHGALMGAVITAPLFVLQHLSLLVGNGIGPALVIMLVLSALAIPFRALLAWVYNRTGSLFLTGLLHAAGNAAAVNGFGDGLLRHLYENHDVALFAVGAEFLVGLAVIVATRARLGVPVQPARGAQEGA